MVTFAMLLEGLFLSSACSMDCLVTGFAYGANKIKIPFLSAMIVNIVCSIVLGLSLFLGSLIGNYIPPIVTLVICCIILIALGLSKIITGIVKNVVNRSADGIEKEVKFKLFSLNFILKICGTPESADIDRNQILTAGEAAMLALALSLDGLAVGVGAGLAASSVTAYLVIIAFSLFTDVIFLLFGRFIGHKIAKKTPLNLSWLSGLLLIGLALMKILYH